MGTTKTTITKANIHFTSLSSPSIRAVSSLVASWLLLQTLLAAASASVSGIPAFCKALYSSIGIVLIIHLIQLVATSRSVWCSISSTQKNWCEGRNRSATTLNEPECTIIRLLVLMLDKTLPALRDSAVLLGVMLNPIAGCMMRNPVAWRWSHSGFVLIYNRKA